MPNLPNQLPNDIDSLKALIAEQAARNTQLEHENARISAKVLSLQEQLNLALALRYAASSEKLSPDQIRLFDEAEVDALASTDGDTTLSALPIVSRKRSRRRQAHANPIGMTM